jgi:hypothetical protein
MAAVTVEDVANMALGILVEAPLQSLDDDTVAGRLLNLHFETTRQAELIKHAWVCAIFRVEASALDQSDMPVGTTFDYAYEVPEDALRVLPLTDTGEYGGRQIAWRQEGGLLLANASSPKLLRYIGNLTDPGDWSPLLVEAISARLAMKIAMPLTGKASLLQAAKLAYDEAISEARRINAIESGSVQGAQLWSEARGDYS